MRIKFNVSSLASEINAMLPVASATLTFTERMACRWSAFTGVVAWMG